MGLSFSFPDIRVATPRHIPRVTLHPPLHLSLLFNFQDQAFQVAKGEPGAQPVGFMDPGCLLFLKPLERSFSDSITPGAIFRGRALSLLNMFFFPLSPPPPPSFKS